MNKVDPFVMRLAIASQIREQELNSSAKSSSHGPLSTAAISALRDLFQRIAHDDESDPQCFALGLDCSPADHDPLNFNSIPQERDILALYPEHLLIVGNPARGASVGGLLKLAFKGLGKKDLSDVPRTRIEFAQLSLAEIVRNGPGTSGTSESFIHLVSPEQEIWFWVDVPMDSAEELEGKIGGLVATRGRTVINPD